MLVPNSFGLVHWQTVVWHIVITLRTAVVLAHSHTLYLPENPVAGTSPVPLSTSVSTAPLSARALNSCIDNFNGLGHRTGSKCKFLSRGHSALRFAYTSPPVTRTTQVADSTLWIVDYTLQVVDCTLRVFDHTSQVADRTLRVAVHWRTYTLSATVVLSHSPAVASPLSCIDNPFRDTTAGLPVADVA